MSGSIIEALIEQKMMKTPYVSKELLDFLKVKFPNELPTDTDVDLGTVRVLQGNQEVIKALEYFYSQHHPTE